VGCSGSDLVGYYSARAAEYEKVYEKPERQEDLRKLHTLVPTFFTGKRVLEVACGTGYWTRRIASRCASVTGCDLSAEVLAMARSKQHTEAPATFVVGDAFALEDVAGEFDAGMVCFWWSHVLRADLPRFLTGLNNRLGSGSQVLIVDNRFVAGSNWAVTRADAAGNTYQRRRLENGAEHEVLKNFPTPDEIRDRLRAAGATDVRVTELTHYWYATYRVHPPPNER
jgi:demethylmenaquinone methyltransferase/2-methoxy-6-polyprenyl-1,4-benzoquinol methylase